MWLIDWVKLVDWWLLVSSRRHARNSITANRRRVTQCSDEGGWIEGAVAWLDRTTHETKASALGWTRSLSKRELKRPTEGRTGDVTMCGSLRYRSAAHPPFRRSCSHVTHLTTSCIIRSSSASLWTCTCLLQEKITLSRATLNEPRKLLIVSFEMTRYMLSGATLNLFTHSLVRSVFQPFTVNPPASCVAGWADWQRRRKVVKTFQWHCLVRLSRGIQFMRLHLRSQREKVRKGDSTPLEVRNFWNFVFAQEFCSYSLNPLNPKLCTEKRFH